MPITWAEVADDAVKIGLGGLITGVFGYLALRSNRHQEERKERQSRIREEFRIIETHLLQTRNALQSQLNALESYLGNKKLGAPSENLNKLEVKLRESITVPQYVLYDTTLIDTKLLLMGYEDLSAHCRDFHDALIEFHELLLNELKSAPVEPIEAATAKVISSRDALCIGLGRVHGELFSLKHQEGSWTRHPLRQFKKWWKS